MRKRWLLIPLLLFVLLYMFTCSRELVYEDPPQTGLARTPEIRFNEESGRYSLEITVLIYNVAGLPWPFACNKSSRSLDENGERIPIACNRARALRRIGDTLGALREQGRAPDLILLQEAFIAASAEIPRRGGYPNWVAGPGSSDIGRPYSERATPEFLAERSFWKGEKAGKLQSSGLLLASNFPIVELMNHPFNSWECGGFDCLANKGLLVAVLDIPGLPDPLAVATTHFNARGASGVPNHRALMAHNLQVDETNEFLVGLGKGHLPFIWGGDLNMRHADDRIEYFVERSGNDLNEVSSFCVNPLTECEVRVGWQTDTPWYDTQDLQGWVSGTRVQVEPIRVKALFDDAVDGVMPSDHDGVLVRYRLSWSGEPG